jgi:hypothetical protein
MIHSDLLSVILRLFTGCLLSPGSSILYRQICWRFGSLRIESVDRRRLRSLCREVINSCNALCAHSVIMALMRIMKRMPSLVCMNNVAFAPV